MIKSREEYISFIQAELCYCIPGSRVNLGRLGYCLFALKHTILCHPLSAFMFYYRLYEYLSNDTKACFRSVRLFVAKFFFRKYSMKCSFTIPINSCDLGLKLPHYGGVIINGNVKIGKNCCIRPFTVIGNKNNGMCDSVPTIGNNVSVGCNVSIIGKVRVGDNAIIGAGSVVVHDVPDNCVVAGNPARVIRYLD